MRSEFSLLTIRNRLYIPPETQEKLNSLKLAVLGCGLASQVCILAARTGVQDFVIADGDGIERSNLNRQAFDLDCLGMNKAVRTGQLIRKINPQASVRTLGRISEDQVDQLVRDSDIAICTVDVGPVYYLVLDRVRHHGKTGLFPMNVGFGSLVFAGSPTSGTFHDIFGPQLPPDDTSFYFGLLPALEKRLPGYLFELATEILADPDLLNPSPPQLGIACYLTAAMVMTIIVKLLEGRAVPQIPEPIMFDLKEGIGG